MPTYLCHGFRWQRRSIRVYVIVQDLDNAAADWVIGPKTSRAILGSFYDLFDFMPACSPPRGGSRGTYAAAYGDDAGSGSRASSALAAAQERERERQRSMSRGRSASQSQIPLQSQSQSQNYRPSEAGRGRSGSASQVNGGGAVDGNHVGSSSLASRDQSQAPSQAPYRLQHDAADDMTSQDWSAVRVLEEYDPLNLDEVSRPYAYVADYVVRIDLSVSITDEIARYEERLRNDSTPAVGLSGGGSNVASDELSAAGKRSAGGSSVRSGSSAAGSGARTGWLEKLRDQLQRDEAIRWYVVVNDDEERSWPSEPADLDTSRVQRQKAEHHAQYTHQQTLFEGMDSRNRERERELLRAEILMAPEREDRPQRQQQPLLPLQPQSQPQRAQLPPPPPLERDDRPQQRQQQPQRVQPPIQPQSQSQQLPQLSHPHQHQRRPPTGAERAREIEREYGVPTLRPRVSVDRGDIGSRGSRPKTPKSGGIRRLFGKSKGDEAG